MCFCSFFHSILNAALYDHLFKHEQNMSFSNGQMGNSLVGIVGPKITGTHLIPKYSATQYVPVITRGLAMIRLDPSHAER